MTGQVTVICSRRFRLTRRARQQSNSPSRLRSMIVVLIGGVILLFGTVSIARMLENSRAARKDAADKAKIFPRRRRSADHHAESAASPRIMTGNRSPVLLRQRGHWRAGCHGNMRPQRCIIRPSCCHSTSCRTTPMRKEALMSLSNVERERRSAGICFVSSTTRQCSRSASRLPWQQLSLKRQASNTCPWTIRHGSFPPPGRLLKPTVRHWHETMWWFLSTRTYFSTPSPRWRKSPQL